MPTTFIEATPQELADYKLRVAALLRGPTKDLKSADYIGLLPARGPSGCHQNYVRGILIKCLNSAGFTVNGRRCS